MELQRDNELELDVVIWKNNQVKQRESSYKTIHLKQQRTARGIYIYREKEVYKINDNISERLYKNTSNCISLGCGNRVTGRRHTFPLYTSLYIA